jgi:hypothetical protein
VAITVLSRFCMNRAEDTISGTRRVRSISFIARVVAQAWAGWRPRAA